MSAFGHFPSQPKVAQLVFPTIIIIAIIIHQDVLGLQISMQNTMRMQIVESGTQLIGQLTGFVLGDRFLDLEQFVEITVGVFGDDADLLVRFERVEDLDDVFV